jgi:hypothetical protein
MTDQARLPIPDADWDYRPANYRDHPDPASAVMAGIKGQQRRITLWRRMTGQYIGVPPTDDIYLDSLPAEQRCAIARLYPTLTGGEYLPDYLPREVEIARVVLNTTRRDVVSIRARWFRGKFRYRVVDEYPDDGPYTWEPRSSTEPLTLSELICLIDSVSNRELEGHGLTQPDRIRNRHLKRGCTSEFLRHFVTVESDLYAELAPYYAWQAEHWYLRVEAESEDEEGEEGEEGAEQDWVDRT